MSKTLGWISLLAAVVSFGCRSPEPGFEPVRVEYVGSSTVANFLQDAERVYGRVHFSIDTTLESEGGEKAIVAAEAQFVGIAQAPGSETLKAGIAARLIGRDAIAVIVNRKNPITRLTSEQIRRVFTGEIGSWAEIGGPDLEVEPLVVAADSATRRVFRRELLGGAAYGPCREVRPDRAMIDEVAKTPGAIGQISFSFLSGGRAAGVRAVAVDGESPEVTNFRYPIARPLYLLWREGNPAVDRFVEWTQTEAGQAVVRERFVGIRVVGEVRPQATDAKTGTLIVFTETYPVYDGGIYYYPHRGYDVLTRRGELVRRVRNHRGENDESPTRVALPAETYLVRLHTREDSPPEFFVSVESGKVTRLDVEELLEGSDE